jgi:hypothetical protein
MKRVAKRLLAFAAAFLIVFSTAFGNAFFVAEASELTQTKETLTLTDITDEFRTDTETDETAVTPEKKDTESESEDEGDSDSKDASEADPEKDAAPEEEDGDAKEDTLPEEEDVEDPEEVEEEDETLFDETASTETDFSKCPSCEEISLDDLKTGDIVYIVNRGKTITAGEGEAGNAGKRTSTVFEVGEVDGAKKANIGEGAISFTVEKTDEYYAFKTAEGKYLSTPDASTQGLGFADELTDLGKWVLDADHAGVLKNCGTTVTANDKQNPQYLACNKSFYFTVLGWSKNNNSFEKLSFYKVDGAPVSEDEEPETPAVPDGTKLTDLNELFDGQKFVLAFGENNVLSTTSTAPDKNNRTKLEPVATALNEEGRLTYETENAPIAALTLVAAEGDDLAGQYYITLNEGEGENATVKYLTTSATGSSLSFADEKDEYSLWLFEENREEGAEGDGTFLIKNAKAVYHDNKKNIDKPQYIEFYGGAFTAYSYVAGTDKKDNYIMSAYTFPELKVAEPVEEEDPANTVAKLLTRELYDGDKVVVYYPTSKTVMTTESNNGKFKAVSAEPTEEGTIETKELNALVLNVSIDDNYHYIFKTNDGKFLTGVVEEKEQANGSKKTYCNLVLADAESEDSVWVQKTADDTNKGNYYLINNHAKNGTFDLALEYYSGFTTYGFEEKTAYVFNFFALEEGEPAAKPVVVDKTVTDDFGIAQWAGNANYDEAENKTEYIRGDKYATNDMMDESAKFSVFAGGKVSQPWTKATSSNTGSTTYYMGATGLVNENDYMQFALSTYGYGDMSMTLRMRASNTAPGAFQLQYSTNGNTFKNFKSGSYKYEYTDYKPSGKVDENGKAIQEPVAVSGYGDISDGIAKTSLAPTYYVTFNFDIPAFASNAENLYIRLVPTGGLSAKGDKAPQTGGVMRVDSVKITGKPAITDNICQYVKAEPGTGAVPLNADIELVSGTEEAEIYYSLNNGEFAKYDPAEKVTVKELPATISAYAVKEGLAQSITATYQYTQAQVEAVKANPNGGAVFQDQYVSLKTKTEGATILYRFRTQEEIDKEETSGSDETKPAEAADETKPVETTDETKPAESTGETKPAEGTSVTTSAETEETALAETEDASEEEEFHNDWRVASGSIKLTDLPCQLQVKAVKIGYKDSAVQTLKFTRKLNDRYGIYFGQIHAHTNISDGAGTLKDALEHASNVANLDYIVITDHSNSIDHEKESKITENVDTAETDEWTYAHKLAKEYTTEDFTCAYGYEMTWSNGLGHMNTFNTPGFQSRTQTAYSTYSTALTNYYAALRTVPDSISQFNHPGTTFGDFQDFAYYTEENDALITMIEVGNGEGAIGSSGYFPSYEYYTRALDKGWHVAPTNNQDNHKGKWGDANTARTVMLADVNDEDAIYDAMRNYRIYATEDNDLAIYYTLEGNIMGSILEKDDVGDHLAIKADITDPTDSAIGKVEVIVNGGQSIASEVVDSSSKVVEFTVPSHYSYYYLKVTEKDGDIAVTAPVWVGEVEACGINSTYTDTVLPVAGEPLDVNVEFYNNETRTLEIDNIKIELSDVDSNKTEVVNLSAEEAGFAGIAPNGTATYRTEFTYNHAGKVTYEVTVNATLNGVSKVYTDKLNVSYVLPNMVADIIIDGTHGNDYVSGYYGGNTSSFVSLCAAKNIRATVVKDEITPEMLASAKLLVVSAPAKKAGESGGVNYVVSHFSDDFLNMVKEYVAGGGSVAVCGLADYSDTTDCQTATEQNKLLEAIGATIRMGSDEVVDDTNNGGQVYRMYPTVFNLESDLMAGIKTPEYDEEGKMTKEGQKYSQYSGCSVDISNAVENDYVEAAEWVVKGYETTYSADCKDASGNGYGDAALSNGVKGKANDNLGNVTFFARQKTKAGGNIYVAGGVFLSDFEVKAEMDNNDSLPYANYTIVNNILEGSTVELPLTTIAEARKGEMNEVFAVEGYVTSGTDNENTTFFDTIYIQDETGGMDIFPYATPGLALGTKVRIVGFLAQYQGDLELKIITSRILDDEPKVIEPKTVSTKDAMDYENYGGQLLKTSGKVTKVTYNADGTVEEFWLKDKTGKEAAIFIDGYIRSATTGENTIKSFVKKGAEVSAVGLLYMHPEGDSDVSVPVFRVRNCDEISLISKVASGNSGKAGSGSDNIVVNNADNSDGNDGGSYNGPSYNAGAAGKNEAAVLDAQKEGNKAGALAGSGKAGAGSAANGSSSKQTGKNSQTATSAETANAADASDTDNKDTANAAGDNIVAENAAPADTTASSEAAVSSEAETSNEAVAVEDGANAAAAGDKAVEGFGGIMGTAATTAMIVIIIVAVAAAVAVFLKRRMDINNVRKDN